MSALTWTGSPRRVRSLAVAELKLLVRNRTAVFTAIGLPLLSVLALNAIGIGEEGEVPIAALAVVMLAGFSLLYVVYYNLVTAYVARREEHVLKRLRVGELTDAEILAATALPSVVVAVVQIVLTWAIVAVAFGIDLPVNAVLIVAGVLVGVVVFVLLAAVSTTFTRNVETAQLSTLPLLFACMIFSGVIAPRDSLPEQAQVATQLLPLSPVMDLVRLGLTGVAPDGDTVGFAASWGEAALPAVVAVAWIVVGAWALRRWFRWEPRS
jgi:ABC-2 type transport system permease protein